MHDFDASHVIIPRAGATLAIFLSGTGGQPQNAMRLLLTVADQGYAVIGLS